MNTHTEFKVRCRAIILNEGKLLVVKHRPDADYYSLPGGHLEPGENIEECVKREIVEELGVEPKVGKLLYVHTLKDRHGNESLECYFEVTNGNEFLFLDGLERTHAHEVDEIRWMNPGEEINLLPQVVAEDFKNGMLIHAETRYTKG